MGSKSSPGGTTTSTQKVDTGPWGPQQQYLIDAFQQAKSNYAGNKANTYYTGESVAPFAPAQSTALNSIIGMGSGVDPGVAAAGRNNVDTINGKYLSPDTNPYLKDTFNAAADPVTAQYMTATAPQTAGAFSGAGRYGSGSYNNAVKQNQLGLGRSLENLGTSIYGGNYQQERDRQMSAVGQAAGLNQAQYINPTAALTAGNQQQQQQQNVDTSNLAAYNYNRDQPTNALNSYISQIGGNYGQKGETVGTQQQAVSSNPLSTGLGALFGLGSLAMPGASGVSALGNIFGKSDRRLKENIRLIGRTFDGQNVYVYNFKGERLTQIGLMAQEVQERMPDAVLDIGGVLHVNYAAALKDAA